MPTVPSGVIRHLPVLARQRVPTGRESIRCAFKKSCPLLSPHQTALILLQRPLRYAAVDLAALEYPARRNEIVLLYADATILWRFVLPRAGWVAQSPALSPAHTPAEFKAHQP